MHAFRRIFALLALTLSAPALAHATLISFDNYTAGTQITTQYTGLTFSGATIYTPGSGSVSAHSGANEVIDTANGAMTITFTNTQTQISGWYTSAAGITISTYGSGSTSSPLSTVTFGSSSAQTSFSITGSGIAQIAITPVSGSFTLDDLNYTAPPPAASQTSEPGSLLLLGTGLVCSAWLPAWRAARRRTSLVAA